MKKTELLTYRSASGRRHYRECSALIAYLKLDRAVWLLDAPTTTTTLPTDESQSVVATMIAECTPTREPNADEVIIRDFAGQKVLRTDRVTTGPVIGTSKWRRVRLVSWPRV